MRECNRCDALVSQRVEAFTSSQRLVVCAACAITLAEQGATIRAHTPPQQSIFVASDGWYSPRSADVTAHQDDLNAKAERYAERVRRVIARRADRATERAA